ncbi:hypothetical protein [Cellulomonas dongxiuzhuiae]|uniref:Tetratricopeptide repeat protein n=1 Tax=Cellulomonas dongxiuzhuiae TaxID=2819979 RepID=A0ABX8GIC9_9CELL|nr:hypothetical protein [Cellulomonas dongxiuzhuiae]MBO3094654.1 hypothetical protein [Cellulomonas dongxiuzhuiae]QWC15663.1 hypothetical protein KKR89_15455 [Cellulomonas dongxiuzhuiae]
MSGKRDQARRAQQKAVRNRAAREARRRAVPAHVRRRRRLLRWSWLPALVLLGLAVNLLTIGPGYREARAAYDAGEEWEAVDLFDRVDGWTFVERWKGAFNAGTARYRAGMYGSAIQHLDEALESVPDEHRCDVQTNRALALQAEEQDTREEAEEQLAYVEELAAALAAQAAGEPYDAELLEPPYEGADDPTVADELGFAGFLLRMAADHAALAAEALADPACTPPPSQGGGGQDEQDQQDQGGGGQDEQDQGGGGQDAAPTPQQEAEQRMQELLDLATDVERLAQAAQDGTLEGAPTPGAGGQEAPDPAQAEAQRQEALAERNQQAGGGGGGQPAPSGGDGTGTTPGGGDGPGTGGSGGTRNW